MELKEIWINKDNLDILDTLHGDGSCLICYDCVDPNHDHKYPIAVKRIFYPSKKDKYRTLKCEHCLKAKTDHSIPGFSQSNPLIIPDNERNNFTITKILTLPFANVFVKYNCSSCGKEYLTKIITSKYKTDEKYRKAKHKWQCPQCNCEDTKRPYYDSLAERDKLYNESFEHTEDGYKIIKSVKDMKRLATNNEKIAYHCSDPNCVFHKDKWFKMDMAKKCRTDSYLEFGVLLCEHHHFIKKYPSKQAVEARKETYIEHFGVDHPMKNPEFKSNYYRRLEDKYGEDIRSTLTLPDTKEKTKQTNLNLYGSEIYQQSEDFKSKIKDACDSRSIEEIIKINNRRIDTNRELYGVDWYIESDECRNKCREGLIREFDTDNPFADPVIGKKLREKGQEACRERYGANGYFGSEEYRTSLSDGGSSRTRKYYYYGQFFDSSWELAVWIYCRDHNIPIFRCPIVLSFEYLGKPYTCNPDFLINGKLIEVKGDHFITKDGTMYLPYRDKDWTDEYYNKICGLYEAKRQCMLNNGVTIYFKSDIQYVLDYIDNVYGKKYLKLFPMHNLFNPSYRSYFADTNTMYEKRYSVYSAPTCIGKGITPFDCNKKTDYVDSTGQGFTPFDIGQAKLK